MAQADLLLIHARLFTMEGPGVGYVADGAVAVQGSRIAAVGRSDALQREYPQAERMDCQGDIVLPGLIDAHMHTGIALLRGTAQDMDHWMQLGIWPFRRHVTDEMAVAGSLVNIIEAMQAGTTTFGDYNSNMAQLMPHYERLGTRARVAEMIHSLPPQQGSVPPGELYPLDDTVGAALLQKNIALYEEWHDAGGGRFSVMFGPQGPDLLGGELLQDVFAEARRRQAMVHMHVAQGDREILQMELRHGQRSPAYLDAMGLLGPDLLAVHLTEATDQEVQLLAKRGAAMVYCPGSIGIIDGLVPPAAEFMQQGGRAALGSDQLPGNNCANMWNEMKLAALFNKIKYSDPKVLPAWKALRMATVEGAAAIGLGDQVGSLKPGKYADMIRVDAKAPTLNPILDTAPRNIVPNLVYSLRGHEVHWMMIHGAVVMAERQLLNVDAAAAVAAAQQWAEKMASKARQAGDLDASPLTKWTEQELL